MYRARIKRVMANKNVAVLLTAASISMYGDWLYVTALSVLFIQDGGLLSLGLYLGVRQGVCVVLQPIIGAYIARYAKKSLLITCDIVRIFLIGLLGWVALQFAEMLWLIFILAVLTAVVGVIFDNARRSLVPLCVGKDDRTALNSLDGAVANTALVLAPAIGGLIIGFFNKEILFLINAMTFLISALLLMTLSVKEKAFAQKNNDWFGAITNAFNMVSRSSLHRGLALLGFCSNAVVAMTWIIAGYFATTILTTGEASLGYIMSLVGVGSIVGMVFASGLNPQKLLRVVFIAIFGLILVNFLWLPAMHLTALVAVVAVLLGISANLFEAPCWSLLQNSTPEQHYSAVFATFDSFTLLGMGYGSILTALFIEHLGFALAITVLSAGLGVLWFLAVLMIRRKDYVR